MRPTTLFLSLFATTTWLSACRDDVTADPATKVRPRDQKSGCYTDTKGSAMVRIPMPGGQDFCIDQRAATQAEFAEFVEAVRPTQKMPTPPEGHVMAKLCAEWIDPVTPASKYDEFPSCGKYYDPVSFADKPMRCMDWCAAYAFCAWSGKRLCGNHGAPIAEDLTTDGSELGFVCSNGGKDAYQFDPSARPDCAADSHSLDQRFPPADCVGHGTPFDQVSSVTGWLPIYTDECLMYAAEVPPTGPVYSPACRKFGGIGPTGVRACTHASAMPRRYPADYGVRCCSD